jgi:hypothetical protein
MKEQNPANKTITDDRQPKKPYEVPKLTIHGTIEQITQGSGPDNTDTPFAGS